MFEYAYYLDGVGTDNFSVEALCEFQCEAALAEINRSIQINQQTLISKIKHQPLNNISELFNQAFIQATKQNITMN